jgi:hypothetical protein
MPRQVRPTSGTSSEPGVSTITSALVARRAEPGDDSGSAVTQVTEAAPARLYDVRETMTAPVGRDSGANREDATQPIDRAPRRPPLTNETLLGGLVGALVLLAVAASVVALVLDVAPVSFSEAAHSAVSPAPLFLIGAAFIALQVWLRPGLASLVKRGMVALAFVLWGVDQLLPPGGLAITLGDIVVALFVVDLAIVIRQETRGDPDEAL